MKRIQNICLALCLLLAFGASAQKKELIASYIATYKDLAIAEMKRTGVPAAITLAQGIHESGAGNSKLVLESNNHFGIKCKSNWTGESVRHDDDAKGECFRKYSLPQSSYIDHSDFLRNGQRYSFLFQLDPEDYQGWANGLKQAGYATNPKYPQVLIKLIEDYALQEYTLIALGKSSVSDTGGIITANYPSTQPDGSNTIIPKTTTSYPDGEFKINETKVIFAKKGTSYLSIAKQYDVDLSKLFEFNDMRQMESVDTDRLIYIQRKRKTGNNEFHVVREKETLHDIAQQEAIRLESLRELNWLEDNQVPAIGETLSLKEKSKTIPRLLVREQFPLTPALKKKKS